MSPSALTREARRFVDAALELEPALERDARQRMRTKLLGSAGVVAVGGLSASATAHAATTSAAAAGVAGVAAPAGGTVSVLLTKIAAGVLALGLAGGGATVAWRAKLVAPSPEVSATRSPALAANPKPTEAATQVSPAFPAPATNLPPAPPPAPAARRADALRPDDGVRARVDPSPVAAPAAPSRPASSSTSDPFSEELAALERARKALTEGDTSRALREIAESERLASARTFAEEREALRVVAVCSTGREAEGRQGAAAFRARFPRSLQIERIERACSKVVTDSSSGGHSLR